MTITANNGRIEYTGNASTTVFAYDFRIDDQAHIDVYLDGVLKTISTHYTVSGVGAAAGGNVTFLTAPGSGVDVLLIRDVPITQATDYLVGAKFPAETHEAALDKLTMIAQQFDERLGRALSLTTDSLFENLTLPDPVSQRLIRWKSDLSGFENIAASDLTVFSAALITTEGDLVIGGAGGVPTRLAIGAAGQRLTVVSGRPAWDTDDESILKTIVDAKGDLIVGTAADTPARLAVGATNGMSLRVASGQASGVIWEFPTTPTTQTFLSGTGATYTTPAGVRYIEIELVGGGGGGGGGNDGGNGGAGTATTWSGGSLSGGGGTGGVPGGAGSGGASSGGNIINHTGEDGRNPVPVSQAAGADGGGSFFGGSGKGGQAGGGSAGGVGKTNTGAGGGGGGIGAVNNAGGGGGAGGYVRHRIAAPAATYTYTVGAGGAGGTAGTSSAAGGAGAAGVIIVNEYYV